MKTILIASLGLLSIPALPMAQTQDSMSSALMQGYEEQFKALVQTRALLADTQKQLADASAELAKLKAPHPEATTGRTGNGDPVEPTPPMRAK